jgi:hypothetical protein
MQDLGRILIVAGVALLVLGILLVAFPRIGLGRLPGDFHFRRGSVDIYIPLATSLIASILLTLLFRLFRR